MVSVLPPAFTHLICSHHHHQNFLFCGNTTYDSWFSTELIYIYVYVYIYKCVYSF